jgi:[ribosomal protein S5]-alanine N-acetyltransferase
MQFWFIICLAASASHRCRPVSSTLGSTTASSMPDSLKSPRLLLQPFVPIDAPALFSFMSDGLAMQHTYVAPTLEQCTSRLSVYEAMRSTRGFAPWVVRESSSGQVVGWGGLSVDPDEPDWGVEVSYAFAPAAWGRGFATELVRYTVAYAFGPLSILEVHAFALPANAASIRVLQKCGFAYLRFEPSLDRNHYVVKAPGAA